MGESLEPRPVLGTKTREGFVGGCTDRDVAWVPEDAVGAERAHYGGILVVEDPHQHCDDIVERRLRDAAVRQTQPVMRIGHPAQRAPPCGFIFGLANRTKRVWRGREPRSNVPIFSERGVNQHEPEIWLIGV